MGPAGTVNVSGVVAVAVADSPIAHFALYTQALDAAGNVGNVSVFEWWVDALPPQPPAIVSAPDAVTASTAATFVVKLPATDASPGQISFAYTVTALSVDGSGRSTVVAAGRFPDPAPVNTAPTTVSLSNALATGVSYTLTVVSVTQSRVVGTVPSTYSWHVLSSAPAVTVLVKPDAVSGTLRPTFTFAADWGGGAPDGAGNVTFAVALVNDPDLGAAHRPHVCDGSPTNTATQRDCVDAGCSASACVYHVTLNQPRGTSVAYTLQASGCGWSVVLTVRIPPPESASLCLLVFSRRIVCKCFWFLSSSVTRLLQVSTQLYSSTGPVDSVVWTMTRCSTTQYAIFSGNDTVTCEQCPVGGDCSGDALTAAVANSSAADFEASVVVTQSGIVAQASQRVHELVPSQGAFSQLPLWLSCVVPGGVLGVACIQWPHVLHVPPGGGVPTRYSSQRHQGSVQPRLRRHRMQRVRCRVL